MGGGGGRKSFLPIPVEILDSYHARHLYDDVITIATMVKMTTTPYKAMDQNSISMTPFVKTIIILNDLFLVRQSSCLPSNWRRNESLYTVRGGGGPKLLKVDCSFLFMKLWHNRKDVVNGVLFRTMYRAAMV